MKWLSHLAPFAAVAVTLVSLSGTARADALPQDACDFNLDAGAACDNAGPDYDQPGVCTTTTCLHPSADGGSAEYACLTCELSDAGVADAGPKSDGGSTTDGGAVTTRPDGGDTAAASDDSGGCSMSPGERDGATGFAMLSLGVFGLALSRRKSSKSRK